MTFRPNRSSRDAASRYFYAARSSNTERKKKNPLSCPTFLKEEIHQFMNLAERPDCVFILEASGLVKKPFTQSRSQLITTSVGFPSWCRPPSCDWTVALSIAQAQACACGRLRRRLPTSSDIRQETHTQERLRRVNVHWKLILFASYLHSLCMRGLDCAAALFRCEYICLRCVTEGNNCIII